MVDIHLTHLIVQVEVLVIARQEVQALQKVLQAARANLAHQRVQAKVQIVTLIRVQINQTQTSQINLINQAVLQNQVLSQSSLMQSMTQV